MLPSLTLWFVGNLFFAGNPAIARETASFSADSMGDELLLDVHAACLLHTGTKTPKPASSPVKAEASRVSGEIARKGTNKGLQETIERTRRWQQQSSLLFEGVKLVKARVPRQKSGLKGVSKELAFNVSVNYAWSLDDVGAGKLGSYKAQFCDRFEVLDPVGTEKRTKKWQLSQTLKQRQALLMPEGFLLQPHAITIAQEYSYTAVYSRMMVHNKGGELITVERSDLLTISPLGCIKGVKAYWSLAGSLLRTQVTEEHNKTKDAIHSYLTALNELGQAKSLDYFAQFSDYFEVHDPFGTAPMTMVAELQKAIPELAAAVAPKGFTVTTEGVTVAADPRYGSAHLVLNIIDGPSIDIIDIFEIESSKVKNLKAVWHLA